MTLLVVLCARAVKIRMQQTVLNREAWTRTSSHYLSCKAQINLLPIDRIIRLRAFHLFKQKNLESRFAAKEQSQIPGD